MQTILLSRKWMLSLLLMIVSLSFSSSSSSQLVAGGIDGSKCVFPGNIPTPITISAASGGSGNYTYIWEKKPSSSLIWAPTGVVNTFNYFEAGPIIESMDYRVHIIDNILPLDAYTLIHTVTLSAAPITAGTVGIDETEVCSGSSPGMIYNVSPPTGFSSNVVKYGWRYSTDGLNWNPIVGANGSNLMSAPPITQTTYYQRTFTEECGGVERTGVSNIITVNVFSPLLSGWLVPSYQDVQSGNTPAQLTQSVPPSGGSTKYLFQWQSSSNAGGPWTNIPLATDANYQPPALFTTTYYRRITKDMICLNEESSLVLQVNVYEALNPGAASLPVACAFAGGTPNRVDGIGPVGGGVPPYTYQWQQRPEPSLVFTDIPGATGWHYIPVPPTQIFVTTHFRRKITDAIGNVAYTHEVTQTVVTTSLTGGSIAVSNPLACYNTPPDAILSTGSATGMGSNPQYTWERRTSLTPWTVIPGSTGGNLFNTGAITERTYYRRKITDYCGDLSRSEYSNEVFVDALPELIAGTFNPSVIAPVGGSYPLNQLTGVSGGTGNYGYQWQISSDGITFTDIIGQTGISYTISPVLPAVSYYRRIDKDVTCNQQKEATIIEVIPGDPLDGGGIYTVTGCVFPGFRPENIAFTARASGGVAPYTYIWERMPQSTMTWEPIPGTDHFDYHPPIQTETVTYRRRVVDALSSNALSNEATIRLQTGAVNPGSIAIETILPPVVCPSSVVTFISTGSATNFGNWAEYQWQTSTDGGTTWVDVPGAIRGGRITLTINTTTQVRRLIKDGCSGVFREHSSNIVTVTAYPALNGGCIGYSQVSPPATYNECDPLWGALLNFTAGLTPEVMVSSNPATGGDGTYQYQWQVCYDPINWIWLDIPGAVGVGYQPPTLDNTHMFVLYRRKATDGCGTSNYSGFIGFFNPIYPYGRAINPNNNILPLANTFIYEGKKMQSFKGIQAVTNIKEGIKVYPNPVTKGEQLTVLVAAEGNFNVSLKTADGRNYPCTVASVVKGQMKIRLPQQITPGIYLIQVSNNGNTQWVEKIVVR